MAGDAGGIRAGRAFVELATKNQQLLAGLAQAQARLASFGSFVKRLGVGIAAALSFKKAFEGFKRFSEMDRELLNPKQAAAADKLRQTFRNLEDSVLNVAAAFVEKFGPAFMNLADIARLGMEGAASAIRETNSRILDDFTEFTDAIANTIAEGSWSKAFGIALKAIEIDFQKSIAAMKGFWEELASLPEAAARRIANAFKNMVGAAVGKPFKGLFDDVPTNEEKITVVVGSEGKAPKPLPRKFEEAFAEDAKFMESQKDVNKARNELRSAIDAANANRRKMLDAKLPDKDKNDKGPKYTVQGTFNAAAASMLGGGSNPMKKVEDNTKKAAVEAQEQTKLLRDIRDNGGLVYT